MEIYANVESTVENTAVTCPVRRIVGIGKDFYIYLRRRAALTNYRCKLCLWKVIANFRQVAH